MLNGSHQQVSSVYKVYDLFYELAQFHNPQTMPSIEKKQNEPLLFIKVDSPSTN